MGTYGPAYDEAVDQCRITKQMDRVRTVLWSQHWVSLAELAALTGDPEASVSAQLRHLRKAKFGGHTILKRRRTAQGGTWEYCLVPGGLYV